MGGNAYNWPTFMSHVRGEVWGGCWVEEGVEWRGVWVDEYTYSRNVYDDDRKCTFPCLHCLFPIVCIDN